MVEGFPERNAFKVPMCWRHHAYIHSQEVGRLMRLDVQLDQLSRADMIHSADVCVGAIALESTYISMIEDATHGMKQAYG